MTERERERDGGGSILWMRGSARWRKRERGCGEGFCSNGGERERESRGERETMAANFAAINGASEICRTKSDRVDEGERGVSGGNERGNLGE